MIAVDVQQQTAEWFAEKCGVPSASNFSKIIQSNGKPSKQRQKYLYQLAGECISGIREESYQNASMIRGIEMEDEARKLYELVTEETVEQVGICYFDEKKLLSCSADGLIGADGGLEIKCPIMSTHVGYLLNGGLPSEYFQQIQGSLYITGRKWWAFMSYYPSIKPLIINIERDEKFISALDSELRTFSKELEDIINIIR